MGTASIIFRNKNVAKKSLLLAVATAGLGLIAPCAFANSINLDTGSAPWTVSRGGGLAIPVTNVLPGVQPGAWISAATVNADQTTLEAIDPLSSTVHNAGWVAPNANAGVNPADSNGEVYDYRTSFTFSGSGVMLLSGTFSVDNWVPSLGGDGVSLTYEDSTGTHNAPIILTSLGGPPFDNESTYQYALQIETGTPFDPPGNFSLDIKVINSYQNSANGLNPGPTGLILAGTAYAAGVSGAPVSVTPIPASVFGGAGMFVLVVLSKLRRRVKLV